jgi:hypothetical protein
MKILESLEGNNMNHRIGRVLRIITFVVIAAAVFGFIIMHLWNWLMPGIFGLHTITYWQGLGLLILAKILFGGFHRHGGGGGRRWKQHMEERWAGMTPEEREKFRAGMRGRHNCGFGRRGDFDRASKEGSATTQGI